MTASGLQPHLASASGWNNPDIIHWPLALILFHETLDHLNLKLNPAHAVHFGQRQTRSWR